MKSELVGERKLVSDKKPGAVGLRATGAVELLVPEDDLEALRKIGSSQLKAEDFKQSSEIHRFGQKGATVSLRLLEQD